MNRPDGVQVMAGELKPKEHQEREHQVKFLRNRESTINTFPSGHQFAC